MTVPGFQCFYNCGNESPSTQEYHIYPYSASEIELVLPKGIICDKCNKYFAKLEQHFCDRHPGATIKPIGVKETRRKKPPRTEVCNGSVTAQNLPEKNTRRITFPFAKYSASIDPGKSITLNGVVKQLPFNSRKISRLLSKMALELLIGQPNLPYQIPENELVWYKRYIRFDEGPYIWFAFNTHGVSSKQKLPVFNAKAIDKDIYGVNLHLSFPGVVYQIPLPPIPSIDTLTIPEGYSGYLCSEDKLYPGHEVPVKIEMRNPKRKDEEC